MHQVFEASAGPSACTGLYWLRFLVPRNLAVSDIVGVSLYVHTHTCMHFCFYFTCLCFIKCKGYQISSNPDYMLSGCPQF